MYNGPYKIIESAPESAYFTAFLTRKTVFQKKYRLDFSTILG